MESNSFISSDNCGDFPLENLPFGVFDDGKRNQIGIAIGKQVLKMSEICHLFSGPIMSGNQEVFKEHNLNSFMSLGPDAWRETRKTLLRLLSREEGVLRDDEKLQKCCFVDQQAVKMQLPCQIGDFTDFFASKYHATNSAKISLGTQEANVRPNWLWMPQAYHSRSSSIQVSGSTVKRPKGQIMQKGSKIPTMQSCLNLDFELEMGIFIGNGSKLGERITLDNAEKYIFGMVLLNDWSARDIQGWEMAPLGPFLCKNFATNISPWIVTAEALEPFKLPTIQQVIIMFIDTCRMQGVPIKMVPPVLLARNPKPLDYLNHKNDYFYDIQLEADLKTDKSGYSNVVQTNFRHLYWSPCQMVAHHTISGCPLIAGDLFGTGTISGPTPKSRACMKELSWGGSTPIALSYDTSRTYLENGDSVRIKGYCQNENVRIGFGECVGTIVA